jgi:hypothetical protein
MDVDTSRRIFSMVFRVASGALLLLMSMASGSATVTIYDDPGGQIGEYLDRFHALRRSGEHVIIDGTCASACAMLLGVLPRNQICVTPRAVFAFHSAWEPTPGGNKLSKAGTKYMWANYPSNVRKWISLHGGLRSGFIYLRGPDLAAMYPACR